MVAKIFFLHVLLALSVSVATMINIQPSSPANIAATIKQAYSITNCRLFLFFKIHNLELKKCHILPLTLFIGHSQGRDPLIIITVSLNVTPSVLNCRAFQNSKFIHKYKIFQVESGLNLIMHHFQVFSNRKTCMQPCRGGAWEMKYFQKREYISIFQPLHEIMHIVVCYYTQVRPKLKEKSSSLKHKSKITEKQFYY